MQPLVSLTALPRWMRMPERPGTSLTMGSMRRKRGETEVVGASWDGSVDIFASAALGNVVGNPLAPLLLREHGGLQSVAEVVGCRIGWQGGLAVGSNVEAPHGVDGGVLVA